MNVTNIKRREKDITKLKVSGYIFTRKNENKNCLIVDFRGPADTIYEGGIWKLKVLLPD